MWRVGAIAKSAQLLPDLRFSAYTLGPNSMYLIPIRIRRYSPTASGGGTVKKNWAWSAGAVRNRSEELITARKPASFGHRNRESSPAIGSSRPMVMKNAASAS